MQERNIHTDQVVYTRKPRHHVTEENLKECLVINTAVPGDVRIEIKNIGVTSGIGAVVKVVDSHPCGWGLIPGKSCSFSHSLLEQELITVLHVF